MKNTTLVSLYVILFIVLACMLYIAFAEASCEAKAAILELDWQYNPLTGCWFNTQDGWFPLINWFVK